MVNSSPTATSPVILITGASSGIGAATARLFASQGYRVVLAARRIERLDELTAEIRQGGGQALPVQTDVSHLEEIKTLVEKTLENYAQIDVLFNNAGYGRMDWLEKLDPQSDLQALLQVNLLGQMLMTQAVLPHMIARRKGHIINMVSVAGLIATPTYSLYAASKFGLRGFSQALRREVSVYGIRVSAIYPGGVDTEFKQHARIRRKTGVSTPAWLRLSAEDVAQSVLDLARRPRRTLVIPRFMLLAIWANALFPGVVDWVIERRFVSRERN